MQVLVLMDFDASWRLGVGRTISPSQWERAIEGALRVMSRLPHAVWVEQRLDDRSSADPGSILLERLACRGLAPPPRFWREAGQGWNGGVSRPPSIYDATEPDIEAYLLSLRASELILCGMCLDQLVFGTALEARCRSLAVTVVLDAVVTCPGPPGGEPRQPLWGVLTEAGVRLSHSGAWV